MAVAVTWAKLERATKGKEVPGISYAYLDKSHPSVLSISFGLENDLTAYRMRRTRNYSKVWIEKSVRVTSDSWVKI